MLQRGFGLSLAKIQIAEFIMSRCDSSPVFGCAVQIERQLKLAQSLVRISTLKQPAPLLQGRCGIALLLSCISFYISVDCHRAKSDREN
jgi:hypothetical protein